MPEKWKTGQNKKFIKCYLVFKGTCPHDNARYNTFVHMDDDEV